MATSKTAAKKRKGERLPTWMTLSLVALLGILIYGALMPKTPSAFDRPEAQINQTRAPWDVRR
jgi:hypothetical protein